MTWDGTLATLALVLGLLIAAATFFALPLALVVYALAGFYS